MTKGRKAPDEQPITDHAAAFRDRLGRAAYDALMRATHAGAAPAWPQLSDEGKEQYRAVAGAVLDAITIQRRGLRGSFEVGSGYSMQRQEPYVEIAVDLSPAQFSPAKAREIGLPLLECAEAAESDAVITEFARGEIGLDDRRAAQLLDQFRRKRDKRRGGKVSAA